MSGNPEARHAARIAVHRLADEAGGRPPRGDHLLDLLHGVDRVAADVAAAIPAANQVEHSVRLRFGFYPLLDRGKGRIDDVQVGKLMSIELFCDVAESFLRVFVAHVIKCAQR